jgi:flagellar biosynthesis/type III secretory pathway chaperone
MTVPLQPEIENALEELLNRETIELAQFIGLLEEELDALARGSADAVKQCANRKQTMLGRIFATRDAVNVVARRLACDPHMKSAEAWLARNSSIRIRRAFDDLTDHADHARQLNQLASRLLHVKLRSINERLDILQPPGLTNTVYHPKGFAAGQMSSTSVIGRA